MKAFNCVSCIRCCRILLWAQLSHYRLKASLNLCPLEWLHCEVHIIESLLWLGASYCVHKFTFVKSLMLQVLKTYASRKFLLGKTKEALTMETSPAKELLNSTRKLAWNNFVKYVEFRELKKPSNRTEDLDCGKPICYNHYEVDLTWSG